MDVLFKRIKIKQSKYLASSIVSPKWCYHFFFYRTGISIYHK